MLKSFPINTAYLQVVRNTLTKGRHVLTFKATLNATLNVSDSSFDSFNLQKFQTLFLHRCVDAYTTSGLLKVQAITHDVHYFCKLPTKLEVCIILTSIPRRK